jgi:hypothetical protein
MDQPVGRTRQFRGFICLAIMIGLLSQFSARAAASESLEYQVKAAFLLNFARFIEWPPESFKSSDAPLSICILGEDPFDGSLDQIAGGEVVNGRKVTIQRLGSAPLPASCRVLFIGAHNKDLKIPPDLGPGVLTVGEGEDFIRAGGMIAFVLENRRVRFDINQTAATSAGFKISSKLLSVARNVQT